MNYLNLQTELEKPDYDGLTNEQILAILNTPIPNGLEYTERRAVNNHASKSGIITKLRAITLSQDSQYDEAIPNGDGLTLRLVAYAGIDFFTIDTGEVINPANEKLNQCVAILQAYGVFTSEEVGAFWDVFRTYNLPLGETVTETDIQIARNQTAIAQMQSLLELAGSGHGEVLGLLQGVKNQLEAGEVVSVPSLETIATTFSEALE